MGWEEKLNPRSTWYLKRHPLQIMPAGITVICEKTGFWYRLVNFIKRVFGQPKSTKGNLSPKEN